MWRKGQLANQWSRLMPNAAKVTTRVRLLDTEIGDRKWLKRRERRINKMAERFESACDIWNGKPLDAESLRVLAWECDNNTHGGRGKDECF